MKIGLIGFNSKIPSKLGPSLICQAVSEEKIFKGIQYSYRREAAQHTLQ